MRSLIAMYQRIGLVPLIIIGLVLGVLIGWLAPNVGIALGLLGTLFVGALKPSRRYWYSFWSWQPLANIVVATRSMSNPC